MVSPLNGIQRGPTSEIVVIRVLCIQHSRGDVRNVATSIALAGNIDLELFDTENCLEILEKLNEVLGRLFLACCGWCANRVSSSNWLVHPIGCQLILMPNDVVGKALTRAYS
jgi:hypothetical protein